MGMRPVLSTRSDDLLQLVFARPTEALRRAHAVLSGSPTPFHASIARQAIGLVERDFGHLGSAVTELRRALALARKSGSSERQADVLATLGIALVHGGRTVAGLASLDDAVTLSAGTCAARVGLRRAGALWVLGRHEDALVDLRSVVPVLRRAKDTVWTGRALTLRGHVQLALGSVDRAEADFTAAASLFDRTEQHHDSAVALHNLGLSAFRSGDLPVALGRLARAGRRYRGLATPMPELAADRCAVLLAAGLAHEALAEADTAIAEVSHRRGQHTRRAELLLAAGRAALACGDPATALARATEATRLFTAQRREWWRCHAQLLVSQARFAVGAGTDRDLTLAARTAARLDALRAPDRVPAHLLAGRIALALCRLDDARAHLRAAAAGRARGPAVTRAEGWLGYALLANADGDTRTMLVACRRGLDVLDEHRMAFGASELRARATASGAELAELAQRACLHGALPRQLLLWSERRRATACAVPVVRPRTDPRNRRDLTALREIASRLEQARADGTVLPVLAARSVHLEQRIRQRTLHLAGGPGSARTAESRALLDELGADRLLEIVAVDDRLHVLVCGAGKVRRVAAGRISVADTDIEAARWLLRRLAYAPGAANVGDLFARLEALGRRLQSTLLGPATDQLGDGVVVVVPPGRLHAVPWALLPRLRDRVHTVAPSATAWLNARHAPAPPRDDVVLVRGPGLSSQGAEISTLMEVYRGALVLRDGGATAPEVLAAIDGSSLAHIAAHGRFRADSPMFSSIRLDDGPLTVYDFEQLRRAPYRVVLPSCDSGTLHPVGADELLGLTTALLPLGTAGIVASIVPVNDAATVPLMLDLHAAVSAGATMAESLASARNQAAANPVHQATALSFVALGAA
ncbi:MAG TPA: CHAT domain-containing protein [Pseudonocardiaceae bacterium]|nr:CHAT domain-containing protein [Pseudonocardiaceae bacterium]